MKRTSMRNYFVPIVLTILMVFGVSLLSLPAEAGYTALNPEPQSDPSTSLARGRALLKQGHADQALALLESALKDFTQTNNTRGIAASEDALGDLYLIQGQYKVALDHYQKSYDAFVVAAGKDQKSETAANSV